MKIDILCTNPQHPVTPWLDQWIKQQDRSLDAKLLHEVSHLRGGDILFLVSCAQIVRGKQRALYRHAMVLHASNLPEGRGWSPHIWAILNGATEITVSLIAAEDKVDTGAIWAQRSVSIAPTALYDEINSTVFSAELCLISEGVRLVSENSVPVPQRDDTASYYPKRTPEDSELDPGLSLASLFDPIRVADPRRYPAYFKLRGETYTITLEKKKANDEY